MPETLNRSATSRTTVFRVRLNTAQRRCVEDVRRSLEKSGKRSVSTAEAFDFVINMVGLEKMEEFGEAWKV